MTTWQIIGLVLFCILFLGALGGMIVAAETLDLNRSEIDKNFRKMLKK